MPAVRQKFHLPPCPDFRDRLCARTRCGISDMGEFVAGYESSNSLGIVSAASSSERSPRPPSPAARPGSSSSSTCKRRERSALKYHQRRLQLLGRDRVADHAACLLGSGGFKSVDEFEAAIAIAAYLSNHNATPKPFVWTKSADVAGHRKPVWPKC